MALRRVPRRTLAMSTRPHATASARANAWHDSRHAVSTRGPLRSWEITDVGKAQHSKARSVGAGLSAGLIAAAVALAMAPAGAATPAASGVTASFNLGVLTVVGDASQQQHRVEPRRGGQPSW